MGKTNQSITINTRPENVWNAIRNFHDMSWAPNVITDVKPVGSKPGNQTGSARILNGVFHETLLELNNKQKTFSYSIDDGPTPLSKDEINNYIGKVTVKQAIDGKNTQVEWTSTWENNDEPVYEFCHNIYIALLDDMKKSLE